MFDYERAFNELNILYESASKIDDWDKDLAEEFIRVGEYGLALDEIAYAYLNSGTAMPTDLFEVFERLAVAMRMEGKEDFEDVAQLRAETKARLA